MSKNLLALQCPRCGAPVTFAAQFCAYCRAALVVGAAPDLARGAALVDYDFTKGIFLPGTEAISGVRAIPKVGLEYAFAKSTGYQSSVEPAIRNGSAALVGRCFDAFSILGIRVRVHTTGTASIGYGLEVRPAHQTFSLYRFIGTRESLVLDPIKAARMHPAIGGIGDRNELELRFADSVFSVLLNGTQAAHFIDARYGFGKCAVLVSATAAPSRVILESFRLSE